MSQLGGGGVEAQYSKAIRMGAELALWMANRPTTSVADIRRRYRVSRATAYRWMGAVRAALAEVPHA